MEILNMPGSVSNIQSIQQFLDITEKSAATIAFFWADFHEPSLEGGQVDVMYKQLATLQPGIKFLKIEAEEIPELSEKFSVRIVPTFLFFKGSNVLDRIEGANVSEVAKRVNILNKNLSNSSLGASVECSDETQDAINNRLKKLISSSNVMLFMKGTRNEPKCGFSRQMVELLDSEKIPYGSFDILKDNEVREALKKFSDWPTYPQLYVKGQLIGGLDIVKELQEEESLAKALGLIEEIEHAENEIQQSLHDLVNSAPVLLFMKGTPNEPKCGFSKKTVELLRDAGISFSSFDILTDEDVRQGLKKFSNWPTYPQLYVNGSLIGGLDILLEMAEEGDLAEELGVEKKEDFNTTLKRLINQSPVMVFMKGNPQAPQCGFSRSIVEILDSAGFQYGSFDILSDNKVREGLKKYSNWPTYPQLYIKGELIGGLDILKELQEEGELEALKP